MEKSKKSFGYYIGQCGSSDTFLSLAVVGLLVLMVVPMSAGFLDFLIALSLASSLGILLMAVYNKYSPDFSIFPTALLLVTLYRLALNVASTRLILSEGKEGPKAAGELISMFGEIVIRGNTFVGILVFIILNVINFIVITKGAGRISEVSARFTLDSLPGKQMAIDSDLKSGAISADVAQQRREELDRQVDFYGSMDGASKFVKGDAVAGLAITGINILGGLFVGIAQEAMSFSEAIQTYTLLTVGDGLVTQLPALIVSTAAGIVVTKAASSRRALGEDFSRQIMSNPGIFYLLSAILLVLGIVMKGAFLAFAFLAGTSFALAKWSAYKKKQGSEYEYNPLSFEAAESYLDILENRNGFQIKVGYGIARSLSKDANFEKDMENFVSDLSKKEATTLPKLSVEDSSELALFEYIFYSPSGDLVYQGRLQEKDFYYIANEEFADFSADGFVHDVLLGRPCKWIDSQCREDIAQQGFLVVSPGELFRWHLFLAYRKAIKDIKTQRGVVHGVKNLRSPNA